MTGSRGRRYTCPRCEQPIGRAELVVFDAGELFHHACFIDAGGAIELVAEFLRRHAPAPFCHGCLTISLHVSYHDVQKAVSILRMSGAFRVLVGQECSGCRRLRVTMEATESQARSAP